MVPPPPPHQRTSLLACNRANRRLTAHELCVRALCSLAAYSHPPGTSHHSSIPLQDSAHAIGPTKVPERSLYECTYICACYGPRAPCAAGLARAAMALTGRRQPGFSGVVLLGLASLSISPNRENLRRPVPRGSAAGLSRLPIRGNDSPRQRRTPPQSLPNPRTPCLQLARSRKPSRTPMQRDAAWAKACPHHHRKGLLCWFVPVRTCLGRVIVSVTEQRRVRRHAGEREGMLPAGTCFASLTLAARKGDPPRSG